MKELAFSTNAIDCTALTLPSAGHSRAKLRLQVKGQDALFVLFFCGRREKQAFGISVVKMALQICLDFILLLN